jgi:hypothetical protein
MNDYFGQLIDERVALEPPPLITSLASYENTDNRNVFQTGFQTHMMANRPRLEVPETSSPNSKSDQERLGSVQRYH